MRVILSVIFFMQIVFANGYLESIYQNIFLTNTQKATKTVQKLSAEIKKENSSEIQKEFQTLIKEWKAIETCYILGDLDNSYIDTPRYIDVYRQGNEDIKQQLNHIIQNDEKLENSLYKNSHLTINALEYILYKNNLHNPRVKQIALRITKTIETNLQEILSGYQENQAKFLSNEKQSNAMILNALADSSYKLMEWRVGDTAGLSKKYQNKPDNTRAEYFDSQNSTKALKAILESYEMLLAPQPFQNFGDIIKKSDNGNKVLEKTLSHLNRSKTLVEKISNEDFSKAKELYESLKKLHIAFYISMIDELNITQKMLDADGD